MSVPFHYVVKMNLVHDSSAGELQFIEHSQDFSDASPIQARIAAFEHYQNYIDVLLESKGMKYQSDKQARENLMSFVDQGVKSIKTDDGELIIPRTITSGIGVFIKVTEDIPTEFYNYENAEELYIHGIGYFRSDAENFIDTLSMEFELYVKFGFDTAGKTKTIRFFETDVEVASDYEILETPFDFSGFDKAFDETDVTSTVEESQHIYVTPIPPIKNNRPTELYYKSQILKGESKWVEFKPSMLYYFGESEAESGYRRSIGYIVAKVIASFLNADGGLLFIGVTDTKEIQGLSYDFSLSQPASKDPRDYFVLEADNIIRQHFKSFAHDIFPEFVTIDGVEIFVFTIHPSRSRPVFLTSYQKEKEFYVRLGASCALYHDKEDIANYCIERWGYGR